MTSDPITIGKSRAPSVGARWLKFIRKYSIPYLFIAVPVLSMVVFLYVPMIISFWWSLNDYSGLQAARFVGLGNYIELLTHDKIFIKSLVNTTLFVLMGMGIGPTLGLFNRPAAQPENPLSVRFSHSLFPACHDLPGGGLHHLVDAL